MSRVTCCPLALVLLLPAAAAAQQAPAGFLPPVKVHAGGKPLDVQRSGHAAPFFGDFDGDGKRDLLVGQFHEGRLRVYRNLGTDRQPRLDAFTWFEAGGKIAGVPVG
jgi:hypothetical protein